MISLLRLLIPCLIMSHVTFAQADADRSRSVTASGIITGKVFDEKLKAPVEYANVALYSKRDSALVTGTVTDSQGKFSLEKLPFGRYFIKISFIGYDNTTLDSVSVSPQNQITDVGVIYIRDHFYKLQDVIVTGEKDEIINNLDKKVITVDKNINANGGSAVEVLQTVPSVSVDVDGNVSLRGSQNITILIDGKPSGLAGLSGSDILNQIPASNIESIEIITNPSVKYDPEGTSGIINIILKKKKEIGFNGQASLNAGTQDKYNTSLVLNYKYNSLNFYTSYDTRFNNTPGTSNSLRSSNLTSGLLYFDQKSSALFRMGSHNVNAGIDYLIDEYNSLNVNYQGRRFFFENSEFRINQFLDGSNTLTRYYTRNSLTERNMQGNEFTISYKRTFEEKNKDLTADLSYSSNSMNGNQENDQTDFELDMTPSMLTGQDAESRNTLKNFQFQANYNQPLWTGAKVESGLSSRVKNISMRNDYSYYLTPGQLINDPTQSNYFDYEEQIHSAYSMLTGNISVLKYQAGLRFEQVYSEGFLPKSNERFENNYTALYPSFHLATDIIEGGEIKAGYSRRVERPNNRQLNPFVSYADSQNIFAGNPKLKPQFTDAYEIGYSQAVGKSFYTASFFFRSTTDIITNISTGLSNGVTKSTFANLDRSDSYGVELTAMAPILPMIRFNGNVSYFRTDYTSNSTLVNNSGDRYSWLSKLNLNIGLGMGFSAQLAYNYNSPMYMPQGKLESTSSTDLAVKKELFDGDLSLNLRVTDLFNTQKFNSTTNGQNFILTSYNKRDSRVVYLGLTYRFLNFDRSKIKDRRDGGDSMDF